MRPVLPEAWMFLRSSWIWEIQWRAVTSMVKSTGISKGVLKLGLVIHNSTVPDLTMQRLPEVSE